MGKTLASPRGGQGFESRRVSIRGGHGLVCGSGFLDSAYYNGQRPGHPGEPGHEELELNTMSPKGLLGAVCKSTDSDSDCRPRTRSVVRAFDSVVRLQTTDSVRPFASDSVRPKKSQTGNLPLMSDSVRSPRCLVRGLMSDSVRGLMSDSNQLNGYNEKLEDSTMIDKVKKEQITIPVDLIEEVFVKGTDNQIKSAVYKIKIGCLLVCHETEATDDDDDKRKTMVVEGTGTLAGRQRHIHSCFFVSTGFRDVTMEAYEEDTGGKYIVVDPGLSRPLPKITPSLPLELGFRAPTLCYLRTKTCYLRQRLRSTFTHARTRVSNEDPLLPVNSTIPAVAVDCRNPGSSRLHFLIRLKIGGGMNRVDALRVPVEDGHLCKNGN
ncbi:hypothetical protein LXL04_006235 [Taraxacum kok-saghyz]